MTAGQPLTLGLRGEISRAELGGSSCVTLFGFVAAWRRRQACFRRPGLQGSGPGPPVQA